MKKTVATLLVAAAALAGNSAYADTATVRINGTVAAKCSANDINDQVIDLGELADTDGKTKSTFENATRKFTVRCNGANPKVSVKALPLKNGTDAAPSGYSNTIDYKAKLAVSLAAGGPFNLEDLSSDSGANSQPMNSPLSANAENVALTITEGQKSGMLLAGKYEGSVEISISPSA